MHCKSWLFFNDESLMRKRYLARLKVSDQVGHNHIKINTDRRKDKSDIPPSPFIIRDIYPSYTEIVCAHILLSCLYYVFTGCAKTCNLSRLIFWTLGWALPAVVLLTGAAIEFSGALLRTRITIHFTTIQCKKCIFMRNKPNNTAGKPRALKSIQLVQSVRKSDK